MRTGTNTPTLQRHYKLPVASLLLFKFIISVGFTVAHRKPGTFSPVPLSADLPNNRWFNQRSDPDSESLPSVLTNVLKTETKIIVRDTFSGCHHFSCLGVSFQGVSCSS